MPEPEDLDFETRLQREVDHLLADPVFLRAPVQSRLLAYLCEQTIAHNRSITQRAVAVDGLGRSGRVDCQTESYPRVQVSRLRRNLALHYARCPPGEGLAIYIRHGDYRLRLASPDCIHSAASARCPSAANRPWKWPTLLAAALLGVVALAGLWLVLRP